MDGDVDWIYILIPCLKNTITDVVILIATSPANQFVALLALSVLFTCLHKFMFLKQVYT